MKTRLHRRHRLASSFSDAKIDALLITSPANWYYLTGYTGEFGALVASRKGASLITDGRFMVQGRAEASGIRIVQQKGALFESVGLFLKVSRARRVRFDPTQVTLGQLHSLPEAAGSDVRWRATPSRGESLQ